MANFEELIESSHRVISDCVLDSGAIVAANTDLPGYPASAVNYRYTWGRDSAFTLAAAKQLGLNNDIKRNFVRWLGERAQDFTETGTLVKRYAMNGTHDWRYGREYQPDQAGALIWALHETTEEPDREIDSTIRLLANGLARQWYGDHFVHPLDPSLPVQDLWEDQEIHAGETGAFSYTLAAAARGLALAHKRLSDKYPAEADEWAFGSQSMTNVLEASPDNRYLWKMPISDMPSERTLDASLSGLAWPFNPGLDDGLRSANTAAAIDEELYEPGLGVRRYKGDIYDGIERGPEAQPSTEGAGAWPLLSFWHAIAKSASGCLYEGRDLFYRTCEQLPTAYIPEQVFPSGDERSGRGPQPLAWGHAMFVLAARQLELL